MTTDQPQPKRPEQQFRAYKREQARISRKKLYPFTAFYTCYSAVMLGVAVTWAKHIYVALAFYVAGIPIWTLVEYFTHRFILHRRFKISKKPHKRFVTRLANKYFDPLHFEHHERPFDGDHISASIGQLLPLFTVSATASFLLFPPFTASMVLAGVVQSYVIEEWVHHSVHFYNLRNPYFRYIRKHHIYHHTSSGMDRGYGFTSGIWDTVFKTRFPRHVRQRLYGRGISLKQAEHRIQG